MSERKIYRPLDKFLTYGDYLQSLLGRYAKKCILCGEDAADYLGMTTGSLAHPAATIYVTDPLGIDGTEEILVCSFDDIEFNEVRGLYCTTVNQTINDLLRMDRDTQVILEALADVYHSNDDSFDSLMIDDENKQAFEKYGEWAKEYYYE